MSDDYYDYHPTVQIERPIVLGGVPSAPYREVGHYNNDKTVMASKA